MNLTEEEKHIIQEALTVYLHKLSEDSVKYRGTLAGKRSLEDMGKIKKLLLSKFNI